MKLRTRVAMVCIVLLVGIVFAAPFRKSVPQTDSQQIAQSRPNEPFVPPLSIQYPASARLSAPMVGPSASGSSPINVPPNSEDQDTAVAPQRPPLRFSPASSAPSSSQTSLPEAAPADKRPANEATRRSVAMPEPTTPDRGSPRWHRVVYGDNLQQLAADYLGSRDHFLLIYEANRDVLSSPNILPIGAELRIPPAPARQPPERPPERPF